MSFDGFVKRTAYWADDYVHGKKVRRFYDDLKKVHKSYETGYPIQQEHLNEMLTHATTYSPYYKKFAECNKGGSWDLTAFPVVNKTILKENYDAICVPIENIPEQEGKPLFIQKTSGSTGAPFALPMDKRKRDRRVAEIKYFNELVGFKSHERLGQCRVWTAWHNKSKKDVFKENIFPISIAKMDEETTKGLIKTVKDNKIVALRAYASWFEVLVDYLERNKEAVADLKTLKVCFSTSETLNPVTYERMLALTGVPIMESYAGEEEGIMGHKTFESNGNYVLNHSGYVFEFLKEDSDEPALPGEMARIVVTDLFNYAFPMIRYDTGDMAVYREGADWSHGWKYISELYGRRMDVVYSTKGEPLHPMNFGRILKNIPGITQYQFIQKGQNDYKIKLNVTESCDVDDLMAKVRGIVGEDANVQIEFIDDIPVLNSGKRKPIVSEWKPEK